VGCRNISQDGRQLPEISFAHFRTFSLFQLELFVTRTAALAFGKRRIALCMTVVASQKPFALAEQMSPATMEMTRLANCSLWQFTVLKKLRSASTAQNSVC
jgi:hypothetical protein